MATLEERLEHWRKNYQSTRSLVREIIDAAGLVDRRRQVILGDQTPQSKDGAEVNEEAQPKSS